MKTFRELKVWQKAHQMVLKIYQTTKTFPGDEKYGLTSQVRRSAASVATNIVEGFKRRSDKDFARFLNTADASLEETKYHLILARDLRYMIEE
jgi:four helix bundle protein